ncbi:MAG TPA: DUF4350 domain-containing protein [Polyangiaceae bacterium]|jgi:hypothetical protein
MSRPAIALAAPFDLDGQDWEGLSSFVHGAEVDLGTQRVVVRDTLALGDLKREDGLVIVHPERPLDVEELSAFMRTGGRIILLDDYGTGEGLCARFGIRRVSMPGRPAHMLRGNPSLAIAEPAGDHPTLHDVDRVVTNHATGLAHQALSPLLVVRGDREPDVLLAVAGAVGHGRLIAVGDGSIVINEMMRYPGNRAFARALVRYAVDDDVWGKRGGKLYVVANGFHTSGVFGEDATEGGALGSVRRSIVDALETARREGAPPAVSYFAALALALGIIVWTSTRVGRVHKPLAPHFVRPVPAALQGGVAGHAAVLATPEGSRALALVEWKNALEEHLATRLGLDRPPALEELVSQIRAAGLLDDGRAASLSKLLAELARVETAFARPTRQAGWTDRVGDARLVAVANQARELLSVLESAPPQPGGGVYRPRAW